MHCAPTPWRCVRSVASICRAASWSCVHCWISPRPICAFSDASQRKFDAHIAETRALRERQLDLYESLSHDEQARVRAAMAERLDRLSKLRERLASFIATKL